jgi:hypothetical protein
MSLRNGRRHAQQRSGQDKRTKRLHKTPPDKKRTNDFMLPLRLNKKAWNPLLDVPGFVPDRQRPIFPFGSEANQPVMRLESRITLHALSQSVI